MAARIGLILVLLFISARCSAAETSTSNASPSLSENAPSDVKTYSGLTSAVIASSEAPLSSYRSSARTHFLRGMITQQLMEKPTQLSMTMIDSVSFVCGYRHQYWKLRSDSLALQGVNSALIDLYKDQEKSTDTSLIGRLISLVKDTYSLIVDKSKKLPELSSREVSDVCQTDFETFSREAYPYHRPGLKANVALSYLPNPDDLKPVLDIIEPPIRMVLQIARNKNRRAAVTSFFGKADNSARIQGAVTRLSTIISSENERSRSFSLAALVEAWATAAYPKDISKIEACKQFLAEPKLTTAEEEKKDVWPDKYKFPYSQNFYACFAAVWDAYEKDFKSILEAAANYDTQADIGILATVATGAAPNTGRPANKEALNKAIGSLKSPTEPTEDMLRSISDFLNLAIAVETAANKDSQAKVQQAIEKFLGH